MIKKKSLNKTVCLKFCSYYKPGKNEDLACRGYTVLERLVLAGRVEGPFHRPGRTLDRMKAEQLVQAMCRGCDFHDHDCDFMEDRSAPPCGGFVLLAQLVADGRITVEEVG